MRPLSRRPWGGRFRVLGDAFAWILTGIALAPASFASAAETRPNVLFIMTDDQGPWALGSAGDPNVRTPHLDRLRAEGARLTNCFSPTPVCSPARASVLTSRYGTEVGILGPISDTSKTALDPRLPTWPRLLTEAGYATALIGKYHLGNVPESHPTRIGYGEFAGFIGNGRTSRHPKVEINGQVRPVEGWTSDVLTDLALDFIRRQQERPWALSLHYWAPHANQDEKAPGGDRTWLPLSDADWNPLKDIDPKLPEPDYPKLDTTRAKRMLREYLGSVHSVDRNVGRLMQALEELGVARNTVVIFTSDHGFNVGHHGIWHKGNGHWLLTDNRGSRRNMWDTSLRVPALIRWPARIPAGTTIDALVSHLDWFPTIAAIAGVPVPADAVIHGRNVLPTLSGRAAEWPDEFHAQQNLSGAAMRSYQTSRWKLVRFHHAEMPDEFYDRVADPGERRNLMPSADPAVRAAIRDLDARMQRRMAAIKDPARAKAPPVEITLRALPDQMRYDVTEFRVFAGDRVRLVLRNDDFMPHNVVVCRPREHVSPGAPEDNGMEVALAAWALGEQATAKHWVPEHARVFAASKILDGQMTDVVEFTAPDQPGRYPYVCTFPGHATSMWGAMQVQARVDGLRDLQYTLVRGPFAAYPDFEHLSDRVAARGPLADGLIDPAPATGAESFALEFEAVLPIAQDGAYTFTVAGDNGPVLSLDGSVVLDHRKGASVENAASATVRLARGDHRLVLRYWHQRDRRKPRPEVSLLWSGPGFKDLPLSRLDVIARRREQEAERASGVPLGPVNNEPAFYRNFLAGVLPSGFGVGYPGGANLTWDPVRMNVGSVWAGAFYDIKRHHTQRGGAIKPIGFAVVDPAPGRPLAVLNDRAAPWPPDGEPRADGYRFLGYTFDAQRQPTFRYRFGNLTVTDYFVPHGNVAAGNVRLTRTLVLTTTDTPPADLHFRLLHGRTLEAGPHGYVLPGPVQVTTHHPTQLRTVGANREVLLPVAFHGGRAEIQIEYAWPLHQH